MSDLSDLIPIFESLPSKHKRYLLEAYAARIGMAKNKRERVQKLIDVLQLDGITPYRFLYLEGNGRLFTWYISKTFDISLQIISAKILKAHPNAIRGICPEVQPDEDPLLHKMLAFTDRLQLDYAYFGNIMSVPDGWNHITARRFRECRVIIRRNPFSLELRRVPGNVRAGLLRSLGGDIGIPSDQLLISCAMTEASQRSFLQDRLNSIPHGVKKFGRGRGLGSLSLTTDGSISLLEQIDYLGNQAEHHEVDQESWLFETSHDDGYMEQSYYYIKMGDGSLRVSEFISERAIDNLRRNVVALF